MASAPKQADVDVTVQAFANWLTDIKSKGQGTLQQMLGEMAVIRDGISANTADLTEFKRHSTQVQQQMQTQLTDLREKLTSAFGEITNLVKQKTRNDQDLMQQLSALQQSAAQRSADLERLKQGYSTNHETLQNALIQLQSYVSVTSSECQRLGTQGEQIERHAVHAGAEIDQQLKQVEQGLVMSADSSRAQFAGVKDDLKKLKEQMHVIHREVGEYKRLTGDVHGRLQGSIRQAAENRKRAQDNQAELLQTCATFQRTLEKSAARITDVKMSQSAASVTAP
jgi:chromosome segregation ATPase